MRYIYQIPREILEGEELDPFYFSELNEREERLPIRVLRLVQFSSEIDRKFTVDNFMLCFNLCDDETSHDDFIMFYPDEKFNKQIEEFIQPLIK